MELATVIPSCATWLPEDDILLKKAVEEGASLEALAKGAIHFSHPFSLQAVRDRWHTLLYNPDISTKACAHLSRDEPDKPKEISSSHRKRKVGSLRSRYFSMLKRVRHDFFSSENLQFLTEYNLHSCTANRDDFHEQGIPQKIDFDILQQNFPQVLTNLTATVCNDGETSHPECPDPLVNNQTSEIETVNYTFPVEGSARIDGIPPFKSNNYGCNNIISRGVQAGSTGTGKLLVPDNDDSISKRVAQKSDDSLINGDFISDGDILDPSDSLFYFPNSDTLFMDMDGTNLIDDSCWDNAPSVLPMDIDGNETYKVEEKAIVIQNSLTSTLNNKPLEYIECKMYCVLNTEDPEIPCNDDIFLLIHAEAPSTSSAMISIVESNRNPEPIIARNSLQELNSVTENEELLQPPKPSLELPCNDDIILLIHPETPCASSDMASVVETDINLVSIIERNNLQGVNSVTKSEDNFQSYKPSLELPCNDDIILPIHPETPCASSDMASVVETGINLVSIIEKNNLQGVNSVTKSEENFQSSKPSLEHPCNDDIFLLIHPEIPCASSDTISIAKTDIYPLPIIERTNLQGLNSLTKSEEFLQSSKPSLDIPCRDDIFLLTHPETPCDSSDIIPVATSDIDPLSIIERNNPQGLNSVKESEELFQSSEPSLEIPCNDDTFLLIHPDTPCASSSATISIAKSYIKPVSIIEENSIHGLNSVEKNEELTQLTQPSHMFLTLKLPEMDQVPGGGGPTIKDESNDICKDLTLNKPAQPSLASVPATNLDKDFKKTNSGAGDTPDRLKELPLHSESGPGEVDYPKSMVNPSISDHEGSESEIDDPTFSDIEAMILDIGLGTCDADLHFTRRVSRYQQENSQRKIIRLEQSARASIQRAMTSRSALAVLYGRRSRHLIRKTEVLLGRSTEDTVVDIDLGKEGCHNKISRNQAILKMKEDGSFLLKNLAKNPMLVNGKEVGTGELASLSSSCLIEIRGISFMFESNQKFAIHFLKNIEKKKQEQMAKFEWLPMEDESMS